MTRRLKLAIVAGEESGDQLGADLVKAIRARGTDVELIGVGGDHLAALGLRSLFPAADIALMGFAAVARDLPRLVLRIGRTARALAEARPDCLVTIDSPDFTLRVARKVRQLAPAVPTVHYVCPSVWAWRPGRARQMAAFVDHVLCILPFEPAELARLGGPPGSFVGHRLTGDPGLLAAAERQTARIRSAPTLLLLPGSRGGEIGSLLGDFRQTVEVLEARGSVPRLLLPTLSRHEKRLRQAVAGWKRQPEILVGPEEKWRAFGEADAALIASGTVSLELALCGVPMVSCYRLDALARPFVGLVKVWSALLPNLIADKPVVPEYYDRFVRPEMLARQLEALLPDTPLRRWQVEGLGEVAGRLRTERPAGEWAADVVTDLASRRPAAATWAH